MARMLELVLDEEVVTDLSVLHHVFLVQVFFLRLWLLTEEATATVLAEKPASTAVCISE